MRNETQLWADKEFVNILVRIKAKRMLNGKRESLASITRKIINTKGFQDIEKQLTEFDNSIMRMEK